MKRAAFSLLVTGDFVLSVPYSPNRINQQIINLFNSSDYNIVNLEAPVTNSNDKIVKTGPHLKADKESTLSVLKALNINLVTLANNHILDYNEQGVLDTLAFCKENSIETVGAGKSKVEAANIFYLDSTAGKISIINVAENEWASATEASAGANGMDLIENLTQIKEAKSKSDFVFVIVHGGHEYYNLPSPKMQQRYRFYAEQGADIVIGHHTHCISGFEVFNGVPIYYSLGNFLFSANSSKPDWYIGLFLEIKIQDNKLKVEQHLVRQENDNFGLDILSGEERNVVENRIAQYSKIIEETTLLADEWAKYIDSKKKRYLNWWSPLSFLQSRYVKAIFNRLSIKLINDRGLALYLNLMRCESHLDLSKEVIRKYLKK